MFRFGPHLDDSLVTAGAHPHRFWARTRPRLHAEARFPELGKRNAAIHSRGVVTMRGFLRLLRGAGLTCLLGTIVLCQSVLAHNDEIVAEIPTKRARVLALALPDGATPGKETFAVTHGTRSP